MKLTIEVDSPKETNLYFPPIGQRIRGRFEPQRRVARNPDNAKLLGEWPQPVPGQQIVIDTDKAELTVKEPLEDDENKPIVDLFKKRGIKVPETKTYKGVHVPSCLHIMKRAVEGNLAKVIEGKMPTTIDGEMLRSFITPDSEDENQSLRKIVAENSTVMRECVQAIKELTEAVVDRTFEE